MIQVGSVGQNQLSKHLQSVKNQQKTGRLTVIQENASEDIYIAQGEVIAVVSEYTRKPLIHRLIRSSTISLDELRKLPPNIGETFSQSNNYKQYTDVQIARKIIEIGLMQREPFNEWLKQETTEVLQQLLDHSNGEVYFEEGVQVPTGRLAIYPKKRSIDEIPTSIQTAIPVTPPLSIDQSPTSIQAIIPVTPSGFIKLPKKELPTSRTLNSAVSGPRQHPIPIYPLTAKVAAQLRPKSFFSWETLLIVIVLLIAGLAHSINMFHYPYYEDDEGTYLSQAWAVVHLGRLAYYTYWYDHAPLGWIQIALWGFITGGFHTFGSAMNSGRIFMLLIQLSSTFILYRIARILSNNVVVAAVVALLFALSPYGLYYHRRVLLDNITTIWMLISILCLVMRKISLKNIWLSAAALAFSILSKEVTVFIIPALAYLVWVRSHKMHRIIALIGWFAILFAILSAYPLLAILKGELFPTGTLLGGGLPHVSLLGTVAQQASRGKDGGIFNLHSRFYSQVISWIHDDPTLAFFGTMSAILSVLFIKRYRLIGIMGLLTLSLWAFLARGGEIIAFYLVPLLPLLALNIGLMVGLLAKGLRNTLAHVLQLNAFISYTLERAMFIGCIIAIVLSISGAGIGYNNTDVSFNRNRLSLWSDKQADAQLQAISWVEHHSPTTSRMIVDEYMWTDLYDSGFTHIHYYWKVQDDPAIRDTLFHNDWRNFDYIITTPQLLADTQNNNMTLVQAVYTHSTPLAHFDSGGWTVEIRKVNK